MHISFEPTQGLFHLQNKHMSYVIQLIQNAYPAHVYWGRPIRSGQLAFFRRGQCFSFDRSL
ncbi:alpha-galactosidase [Paenibacillus sp. yr247]|nr:alpha-galactosidase [Paenibacillus sp. yr247]